MTKRADELETVRALGKMVCEACMLCLTFAGLTWQGYVRMRLWAWHIVPVFRLPELGLSTAAGVMLIATHMTFHLPVEPPPKRTTRQRIARHLVVAAISLAVLGYGWIAQVAL